MICIGIRFFIVFTWLIISMVLLLAFRVFSVLRAVFSVSLFSVLKFLLRNSELIRVLWLIRFESVSVSVRLTRKFSSSERVRVSRIVFVC